MDPYSFCIAAFKGEEHEVPEILNKQVLARLETHRSATQPNFIWEGVHIKTKNKITVAQRIDKILLLSMHEQSEQILQLRVSKWGPLPNVPEQHAPAGPRDPTLQIVLALMQPWAESYCQDKITIEDLKALNKIAEAKWKPSNSQPTKLNLHHPLRWIKQIKRAKKNIRTKKSSMAQSS